MEDQSWWRKTLEIWCHYLAVGLAEILAGYVFVGAYANSGGGPLLFSLFVGVAAAVAAWTLTDIFFLYREIAYDVREARRRAAAAQPQDGGETPEVERLKAETRRLIETMRAA
jgi:hypothetical protein